MNALAYYLPNILRYSTPPTTIETMQKAVADKRRMWYVSVGEFFDREGDGWARANVPEVPHEAWRVPGFDDEPRDGFHFPQSEAVATIFFHPGTIPDEIHYGGKQGFANDGPAQVRLNPGDVLEAELEKKGGGARTLEIEFASKKPAAFEVLLAGQLLARVIETGRVKGEREMQWDAGVGAGAVLVQVRNMSAEDPLFIRRIAVR
jgi:hypothetical protein